MKNNFKLYFILVFFYFVSNNYLLSSEFVFNASEVIVLEKGNKLKAINGIEALTKDKIKITGNEFEYDKKKNELRVFGNVYFIDSLNDIKIKTEEIIYFRDNENLLIKEKSFTNLYEKYFIESKNLNYYRSKGIISSNNKTKIKDIYNNNYSLDEFEYSKLKNIIKGKNVGFLDPDSNKYFLEEIYLNLENKNIAGKDLDVSFNNNLLNNTDNEPRMKGKSVTIDKNNTIVSKGSFTTCKKRDGCPPWVMHAAEVEHDKLKKTIYYKNAWLKIYDVPVLYFPKFFHPDPTVKRQSGFLMPTFSDSSILGPSVKIPYYKVIADNKDLTFTPQIFKGEKIILQSEYRQNNKNSTHTSDFSIFKSLKQSALNTKNHFFLSSHFDLESNYFDNSKLNLEIQTTSNDTYLKTYKIKSPLINNETTLTSFLNYEGSNDDLYITAYTKLIEDQSKSKSDRNEFIYPYFSLSKNIDSSLNKFGQLNYSFGGNQRKFNANEYKLDINNNLNFKSNTSYTDFGFAKNYEIVLKNSNINEKNSSGKTEDKQKLMSAIMYTTSLPLKKNGPKYNSFLSPNFSLRFSPNETKNIQTEDRRMEINNIYSLNRISQTDAIEGGASVTLGTEYKILKKENDNDLLSLGLAQVYRNKHNNDLPTNSSLGNTSSDVFGNIKFTPNEILNIDYNFSYDNSFSSSKYDHIKASLTVNNFITTFEILDDDTLSGNTEDYVLNTTTYNFDENNSLTFKTRENRKIDLTEYYNLIYEYKNDCLVAGIEYNKQFYNDGDLKPEEKLFFSITITPFGKTNSPNINR